MSDPQGAGHEQTPSAGPPPIPPMPPLPPLPFETGGSAAESAPAPSAHDDIAPPLFEAANVPPSPAAPPVGQDLAPLPPMSAPPAPPYAQGGYPGPYASPGAYGQPGARRTNGLAVAGFIVGLVSVFLPLFFGLIGGIVGLVLSIVGVVKHNALTQSGKGLGIAGIILSAIAIVFLL